jgi:hypothetical protein
MTTTFFTWLVLLLGTLVSGNALLYVFMVLALFGAAAAIILPALGGATITPVALLVPLLFVRVLTAFGWRECRRQIAYPSAGFWLSLTAVWGVLSGYFLPRLFDGEVMINSVDRDAVDAGIALVPLHPVSGNLTQSGYIIGGVCAFAALSVLLSNRQRLGHFRDAVLLLAALNCVGAIVNVGELYFSFPRVLQFVRTAGYAIFDGGELGGLQRVSGTFSETSAFSAFTLPLFAFTLSLWSSGVRPRFTGSLALTSSLLLLISTSATAYVGLAMYLFIHMVDRIWQGRFPLGGLMVGVFLAGVLICSVLLLEPELAKRVGDFFDATVLNKLSSASGVERGAWNQQAWSNVFSTYGLGVGLGSAKASSYPLVLLSNLGVVGTCLFAGFIIRLFTVPAGPAASEAAVVLAARQAVIAVLCAATLSSAVFYLGMSFYAFAAAAQGRPSRQRDGAYEVPWLGKLQGSVPYFRSTGQGRL